MDGKIIPLGCDFIPMRYDFIPVFYRAIPRGCANTQKGLFGEKGCYLAYDGTGIPTRPPYGKIRSIEKKWR